MKSILLVLVLNVLTITNAFSQINLEEIENNVNDNITISDSTQKTKALLLGEGHKIPKIEINRNYYWFGSNKIFITQGGYGGRLLHGEYISYFANNNIKNKGNFKFGLKEGIWLEWHDNGNIKSSYSWKKGILHGKFSLFDREGKLLKGGKYRRGKLIN